MAKILTLTLLSVILALAATTIDANPLDIDDEPRMDDDFDADVGLNDDGSDEDDNAELDRADDPSSQLVPTDRRCRKGCRRGYTLSRNHFCRCVRRSTPIRPIKCASGYT